MSPPGGGLGGRAELEVGWKLHPRVVLGASASFEVIGGVSEETGQVARITPALVFELLL